jgi:hypothetical protein
MRLGKLLLFTTILSSCARPPLSVPQVRPPPKVAAHAREPTVDRDEDPYLAVPRVLDGINQARAAQGVAPVRLDRALCALAQQGTAVFFQAGGRGVAETRTATMLGTELDRFRRVYLRARAAVLAPQTLSEVVGATQQTAMDSDWQYVGIAVEQQRQETAVVLIFAQ